MARSFEAVLSSLPGHIGFYYKDLGSGETVTYHADEAIEAASVIKLMIMAAAFRQREAGLIDFDARCVIRPEDKMPSCGALSYMHDGLEVTVGDLVSLMIILSDNTAANLMIDRLGIGTVNEEIRRLGLSGGTDLERKLFSAEDKALGLENHVTARDMGLFLEMLHSGRAVTPDASSRMLDLLGQQRLNGKMPFFLKPRGIVCAHKTGEDEGITHDVGIIYARTPRVFCFLSEKTDVPGAERALQDLALEAATR